MENDTSNNSPTVACIRCRGNVFTEPLPTTEWRDTLPSRCLATAEGSHIQTQDCWDAVQIGSAATIHIPRFTKGGSGIRKLLGGEYADIQTG
jgi:hypothetical protein